MTPLIASLIISQVLEYCPGGELFTLLQVLFRSVIAVHGHRWPPIAAESRGVSLIATECHCVSLLQAERKFTDPHACFYASSVMLAFEYLHDLNVISSPRSQAGDHPVRRRL